MVTPVNGDTNTAQTNPQHSPAPAEANPADVAAFEVVATPPEAKTDGTTGDNPEAILDEEVMPNETIYPLDDPLSNLPGLKPGSYYTNSNAENGAQTALIRAQELHGDNAFKIPVNENDFHQPVTTHGPEANPGEFGSRTPFGILGKNTFLNPINQMNVDLAAAKVAEDVYSVDKAARHRIEDDHYVTYTSQSDVDNVDSTRSWKRLNDSELEEAGLDPALFKDHKGILGSTFAATGFKSGVYRSDNNEYILAFGGTDPIKDIKDVWTDVKGGTGGIPEQFRQAAGAAIAAKEVFGDNLVLAGHSLGGGLAAYASVATGGTASVTFNPMDLTENLLRSASDYYASSGLPGSEKVDMDRSDSQKAADALEYAENHSSRQYHMKGEFVDNLQNLVGTPDFGKKTTLDRSWVEAAFAPITAETRHLWGATMPQVEDELYSLVQQYRDELLNSGVSGGGGSW